MPLDCDNMGSYRVTDYIFMLPRDIQKGIRGAVNRSLREKFGLKGAELRSATDEAMAGRLSSLNSVINVRYWLDRANTRSSR